MKNIYVGDGYNICLVNSKYYEKSDYDLDLDLLTVSY